MIHKILLKIGDCIAHVVAPATVFIITSGLLFVSCYSFKGGAAPAHLRNIEVATTEDISGFSRPSVRQDFTQTLITAFRDDNSLKLTNSSTPDSRIETTLATIRTNERLSVSNAEFETTRLVVIEVRATFVDNVKKKNIFKEKFFTANSQYLISSGVTGENEAIKKVVNKITNDILLECVAAW